MFGCSAGFCLALLNIITCTCGNAESSHAANPALDPDPPPSPEEVASPTPTQSSWTTIEPYQPEPAPVAETPMERVQTWVEGVSSGPSSPVHEAAQTSS
ncbi:hypothetical protein F66182_9375 [Fusarium sp. NRRL 66182]|nr:hypothetical protein F66182_9375 [Fusarium sp. NRRL 66182]